MNIQFFAQQVEAATTKMQLQCFRQQLYREVGNRELDDDIARQLEELIFAKQAELFSERTAVVEIQAAREEDRSEAAASVRPRSIFPPRRHIASPDRERSRARRRRQGLSRSMPDAMAEAYTEALRSVAHVVAEQQMMHGRCTLPNDQIAALAGVCRSTVRNYRVEAVQRREIEVIERPVRGGPNDPNIIRVTARDWLRWLEKRAKMPRGIGCKGFTPLRPTKTRDINTADFSRVDKSGGSSKPPGANGQAQPRECGAPS